MLRVGIVSRSTEIYPVFSDVSSATKLNRRSDSLIDALVYFFFRVRTWVGTYLCIIKATQNSCSGWVMVVSVCLAYIYLGRQDLATKPPAHTRLHGAGLDG